MFPRTHWLAELGNMPGSQRYCVKYSMQSSKGCVRLLGHALAEELARRLGMCCMLLVKDDSDYIAAAQPVCSGPFICSSEA